MKTVILGRLPESNQDLVSCSLKAAMPLDEANGRFDDLLRAIDAADQQTKRRRD